MASTVVLICLGELAILSKNTTVLADFGLGFGNFLDMIECLL
jgi:hypothetical protein